MTNVLSAGAGSGIAEPTLVVLVSDPTIGGRTVYRDPCGRVVRHRAERAGHQAARLRATSLRGYHRKKSHTRGQHIGQCGERRRRRAAIGDEERIDELIAHAHWIARLGPGQTEIGQRQRGVGGGGRVVR